MIINEREQIIELIKKSIELNIDNCKFMKKLYKDNKEVVKTFNLSIRQSKKALDKLPHIKHIELLRAIYGDVIGKMSGVLMLGGTFISSDKLDYFDKTDKGFQEFSDLQEQKKKEYQEKIDERKRNAEAIKKAKEEGKQVEYMIDPVTKKLTPIILNKDESNA